MKQLSFIERKDEDGNIYTTAPGSPLYVPRDRRPAIGELYDQTRLVQLLRAIEASSVSDDEKAYLRAAAQRHVIFNYERAADYYAHATPEMQRLMEASALVIVDLDQAIERGYVRLCDRVRALYMEELARDA